MLSFSSYINFFGTLKLSFFLIYDSISCFKKQNYFVKKFEIDVSSERIILTFEQPPGIMNFLKLKFLDEYEYQAS